MEVILSEILSGYMGIDLIYKSISVDSYVANDYSWFHIESIAYGSKLKENYRDVMVKLRLKRCGRKQRATWRTWLAVDSDIHHLLYE